jgi:hypothetical protein
LSVDEKEDEQDAIRSSKEHCDLYLVFVQKLRYSLRETGQRGMIACGNDQSLRPAAVQILQE